MRDEPPPSRRNRVHAATPDHASRLGRGVRDQRGSSYIELVFAIFIFVAAGAGLLGAYLYTHELSMEAEQTVIALNDAGDIMERIRTTPFTILLADFPDGVVDGNGAYAPIVGGYVLGNQQITVDYPAQAANRLEMLVTVTWTNRTRPRTVTLSTIRTSS